LRGDVTRGGGVVAPEMRDEATLVTYATAESGNDEYEALAAVLSKAKWLAMANRLIKIGKSKINCVNRKLA